MREGYQLVQNFKMSIRFGFCSQKIAGGRTNVIHRIEIIEVEEHYEYRYDTRYVPADTDSR
jgi:hypothetical protein